MNLREGVGGDRGEREQKSYKFSTDVGNSQKIKISKEF